MAYIFHIRSASKCFLLRHCRKFTTRVNKIQSGNLKSATDDIRSKILFSSYLENREERLGYKQNKIMHSKFERKEYISKLKNNVKPFPSMLKFIQADNPTSEVKSEPQNHMNISEINHKFKTTYPKDWMQEYEYYEGGQNVSANGTPDPTIPPSQIPCNGCGANLHCADSGYPGYIPSEIFRGRNNTELKTIICQRCHFLKHYNIALDVTVTPETYVNILSSIKDKYALAILIVDLLDFPCSIWPEIQEIVGYQRPIFIVGNKVDLLPKDSANYLDRIKKCLTDVVIKSGLNKLNIKHVSLISAKTGYGIEELITQLHKIWSYKGDVYLVGCTNVGKSSLFNCLLKSDYCKVQAIDLVKKATACPWPGTTLNMLKFPILRPSDIRVYQRFRRLFSERAQKQAEEKLRRIQLKKMAKIEHATLIGRIGRTFKPDNESFDQFSMSKGTNPILVLNEKSKEYVSSKWCYDTPGVIQPDQIHSLLTTEELLLVAPQEIITPRVFLLKPSMSLFLAGLGRIDFLSGDVQSIRFSVYSSMALPITISYTEDAEQLYKRLIGTEILGVPIGDRERLSKWPALKCSDHLQIIGEHDNEATCDILLSSAGWVGLTIPKNKLCSFKAWTPEGRGIIERRPPLIPLGENLRGQKIRGSLAYRIGKPFIKQ